MKRIRWFFFCVLMLMVVMTGSCPPGQPPASPPTPAGTGPVETAAVTSPQPAAPAPSMRFVGREIPAVQISGSIVGMEMRTKRIVGDFDLEVTGPLDLVSVDGALENSDESEYGSLILAYTEGKREVAILLLSDIKDKSFQLKSSLLLLDGTHRFYILVESTHEEGDTLQVELRGIRARAYDEKVPFSQRTPVDVKTAFRWPAVVCGE